MLGGEADVREIFKEASVHHGATISPFNAVRIVDLTHADYSYVCAFPFPRPFLGAVSVVPLDDSGG